MHSIGKDKHKIAAECSEPPTRCSTPHDTNHIMSLSFYFYGLKACEEDENGWILMDDI